MKFKSGQISIALISVILGIMLAVQFQTNRTALPDAPIQRAEKLMEDLKKIREERDQLQIDLNHALKRIYDYEQAASKNDGVVEALKEDLEKTKVAAGMTALTGPGITVTLNDSDQQVEPGQDVSPYLIHNEDLLRVINELKAGGAEAISLNGERLVATSEVRCVGPTVMVNGNRYATPYVIQAIGDPATLENSLRMKGGVVESLEFWGIKVDIKKADNLTVPAFKGTFNFRYAKPVKEEGAS